MSPERRWRVLSPRPWDGELVTKEYLDSKLGELRAEMNGKFTEVDGRFTLLYWMVGFNLALTAAVLMKLVM